MSREADHQPGREITGIKDHVSYAQNLVSVQMTVSSVVPGVVVRPVYFYTWVHLEMFTQNCCGSLAVLWQNHFEY